MEDIPHLAVGNDQLGGNLGKTISCPHCKEVHEIKNSRKKLPNGETEESKLLQFYECGEHTYLCGINGRRIKF